MTLNVKKKFNNLATAAILVGAMAMPVLAAENNSSNNTRPSQTTSQGATVKYYDAKELFDERENLLKEYRENPAAFRQRLLDLGLSTEYINILQEGANLQTQLAATERRIDTLENGTNRPTDDTDPFAAQTPTEARPYWRIQYNAETKAADPNRRPWSEALNHPNKIVVFTWGHNNDRFSDMQDQVVYSRLATSLGNRTKAKDFMVVDVSIPDYHAEAMTLLLTNGFGTHNERVSLENTVPLPQGETFSASFREGEENQVVRHYNFALLVDSGGHPILTDEQLNGLAHHIYKVHHAIMTVYNRKLAIASKPGVADTTLALDNQ